MDNGLIFPYRRMNAPAEANDAKHASTEEAFGLIQCESATQVRIRQAEE